MTSLESQIGADLSNMRSLINAKNWKIRIEILNEK